MCGGVGGRSQAHYDTSVRLGPLHCSLMECLYTSARKLRGEAGLSVSLISFQVPPYRVGREALTRMQITPARVHLLAVLSTRTIRSSWFSLADHKTHTFTKHSCTRWHHRVDYRVRSTYNINVHNKSSLQSHGVMVTRVQNHNLVVLVVGDFEDHCCAMSG